MSKLIIAEKPSVAREFAKALQITGSNRDGYIESNDAIVTWCVGHLVTMSYPEVYDEKYKKQQKPVLIAPSHIIGMMSLCFILMSSPCFKYTYETTTNVHINS